MRARPLLIPLILSIACGDSDAEATGDTTGNETDNAGTSTGESETTAGPGEKWVAGCVELEVVGDEEVSWSIGDVREVEFRLPCEIAPLDVRQEWKDIL